MAIFALDVSLVNGLHIFCARPDRSERRSEGRVP
jgi:hypothetical protein